MTYSDWVNLLTEAQGGARVKELAQKYGVKEQTVYTRLQKEKIKPGGKKALLTGASLCASCVPRAAAKCIWYLCGIARSDWTADKTCLEVNKAKPVDSFRVRECPGYERDEREG